jgi:hypothetical protein
MYMDITPYVESLRRDLMVAAEAGGDDIRGAAERLSMALDPAARLAMMEVLSHAAAEITAELPSGGVDVRLQGRELDFVVTAPAVETRPTPVALEESEEVGSQARITLRIPESVKARAEEFAEREGQSLNTWLVGIVRMATHGEAADIDLSSIPFFADPFARQKGSSSRRMTGWI